MEILSLPDYVTELLFQIARDENFDRASIKTSAGSGHCDGFIGVLSRVILTGIQNGFPKKLSLICKMAPENKVRRAAFNTIAIFEREVFVYRTILSSFVDFQRDKGIDKRNGFFAFPKIYAAVCDVQKDNFVIIMDDLVEQGFQLWNRLMPMDLEHVKVFVAELGRFHAISFALRDQMPAMFDDLLSMEDTLIKHCQTRPDLLELMFERSFEQVIECLDPNIDGKEIQKVQQLQQNYFKQLNECVERNSAGKYGVFNHGDCWGNNLMFAYDETTPPKVNQVFLIDWQLGRIGSPAMDLSFFIFTSTDQKLRSNHYSELLEVYHQALSDALTRLGSDPETLFPFAELERQLKLFGRFGVIMSHMVLQLVTVNPSDISNLEDFTVKVPTEGVDVFESTRKGNLYSERIVGVIKDAVRLGYI